MSASAPVADGVLVPGYSLPSPTYYVVLQRYTSSVRLLLTVIGSLAVIVAAMAGFARLTAAPSVHYACPPDCGRPPTGIPVQDSSRFEAADGSFSVAYPSPGSAYRLTFEDDGLSAEFTAGDGGTMELFGVPAKGRSPQQVIDDLLRARQPDATVAYVLPNATVGYQLGHGEVLDVYPQGGAGGYDRTRIVVLAAVKNDLALVGAAIGPYRQFGPDYGPGPPSAANLDLAQDLGKYVNSFLWKGDAPR